ncbi:MAG TPA: glycerol-3-phosphate acyltransferase [Anaerolineae bacterium]|nr:glycerol-3-phosphate acyltransferase [Anaerolineae bacterium]HQH38443.1 glycerol-3-phosphate acyltransferase [Anaerolineae bacterium]
MLLQSFLLIIIAYLLGSIPTAQLVTYWLKGADLRRYGSGTVSGSMVWEHVAHWAIVPVGLFDIAKAAFPTWMGLRLGLERPVAAAAGLAAAVGHNWPIYLHFTGGRGLSCFLGIWLLIFPWGFPWLLGFLAVGCLLGDSAPWALVSLVTLPLCASLVNGPAIVTPLAAAMLLLTLVKRLEANRRPLPPPGPERRQVILYRLLLDRDIRSHQAWIRRRADEP